MFTRLKYYVIIIKYSHDSIMLFILQKEVKKMLNIRDDDTLVDDFWERIGLPQPSNALPCKEEKPAE